MTRRETDVKQPPAPIDGGSRVRGGADFHIQEARRSVLALDVWPEGRPIARGPGEMESSCRRGTGLCFR